MGDWVIEVATILNRLANGLSTENKNMQGDKGYDPSVTYCGAVYQPNGIKMNLGIVAVHDDVIRWKYFPRYWPFVREIHRSPVNFPHKGQWRGALMFTLICAQMNGWVNNGEAGDLRRYLAHYDVIVMDSCFCILLWTIYISHEIKELNQGDIWFNILQLGGLLPCG